MSRIVMPAGPHVVVSFSDDQMGARIVVAPVPKEGRGFAEPIVIARTQAEVREVIRVLRELTSDLPAGSLG